MRNLIRELAGALESMIGLDDAAGFISVVGRRVGLQINDQYREALESTGLTREQVEEVLVDLKRRIQGDFYVIESTDRKIVLGNRACPFADRVKDRRSMCMMTSNVFGTIAAENLGYARVVLEETIAEGDPGCRVVVHLDAEADESHSEGRAYFRTE